VNPRRALLPVAILAVIILLIAVLVATELLTLRSAGGTFSMAPALPACNGKVVAEGFTYRFRDPQRGEIVVFHARGKLGSTITPDAKSRALAIDKRLIGIPGDTVVGRGERVFVNGSKADDIPTLPFPRVQLGPDEYFVLGDNRDVSHDSRDFGPVPRDAIFAQVVLVAWPFERFGVPEYDKSHEPPGALCGSGP
jgi:signal peptidase I